MCISSFGSVAFEKNTINLSKYVKWTFGGNQHAHHTIFLCISELFEREEYNFFTKYWCGTLSVIKKNSLTSLSRNFLSASSMADLAFSSHFQESLVSYNKIIGQKFLYHSMYTLRPDTVNYYERNFNKILSCRGV